jgi:hypothetical protein
MIANKNNAQHSTGPQDTTRSRFNGVQHGLTSNQTVIPGESQEEYDQFEADFRADLNRRSALETTIAERVIAAAWRLKRFQRMESAFYNDRVNAFLDDNPGADPNCALANLFIDPVEISKMRLFLRYQSTVQREFDKAMAEYTKLQAERAEEPFEETIPEAATQPTPIRVNPCESVANFPAAVGFASQPAPTETNSYFTHSSTGNVPVQNSCRL